LYMKKDKGVLRVENGKISFWSGWSKQERWSVPVKDIKKVEVEESDKITKTRALLLGFGALIFKKHKKFLVLSFDVAGMESAAIFDFPGDSGDQNKMMMMQEIIKAKQAAG